MSRLTVLIWMVVIVGAAFLLYMVKYEVQSLRVQIAETSRDLEFEREALHVIAAEWEYLNRPDRLKTLSGKYLASSSITVDRIAEVEAIPFPKQSVASSDPVNPIQPVSAQMQRE